MARTLGIVLIVLGLIGLIAGGISYSHRERDAKIGPISIEHTEHERMPIPPIAAAVSLIAGTVLLVAGRSRTRGEI